MKRKHTLLLLLLFVALHLSAQQHLVLIEEFTNTGCNPCASWSPELDQVIEDRLGEWSPTFDLGEDASKQFIAKLGLLLQFASDCDLNIKVVVAKDGEHFSSADVIGTITNDQLPTSDAEPVDYEFPFSGYTGAVRLGFYFEGSGTELSWFELTKVGTLFDTAVNGLRVDTQDEKVYNLQGVRLNNPQRGFNIINGKKVVVK